MGSRTDTELLDALESEGCGIALIHDDDAHWYVVGDGMQNAFTDGPVSFSTSYWVSEEDVPYARKTVREAIEAWMDREE